MIDEGLTPEQRSAVAAGAGTYLLKAPPGAGKTEVLVRRAARILRDSQGENFRVLALTHTTRAAEAITRRISGDVADEAWRLTAETIHAFCRQILDTYGGPVGVQPGFSVISADDERLAALAEAVAGAGFEVGGIQESDARELLSSLDKLRSVDAPGELAGHVQVAGITNQEWLSAYDEVLNSWHSLDFVALLWRALQLLGTDAWTQRHLSRMHRFVLLDETQDCTPTQLAVIQSLLADEPNLFVAASEAQSIYAFGGARPDQVLGTISELYGPQILTLSSNFRSAVQIVEHANALANHLPSGRRVIMTPSGHAQGRVEGVVVEDEQSELAVVVQWIDRLRSAGLAPEELEPNEGGTLNLEDIAVLARTRWQLAPLAKMLESRDTEVALRVSDEGAVDSRTGRAVHAALNALANPSRPGPRRELVRLASDDATPQSKATIGHSLAEATSGDPALQETVDRHASRGDDLEGLMRALLAIRPSAEDNTTAWDVEREELERCWAAYCARTLPSDRTLSGFRAQLGRLREASLDHAGVRLLTLHAAKGAEFKAVAVMGLNEKTIPHYRAVDAGDEQINEERQSLYVAVTRPSRALLITRPRATITRSGKTWAREPSRFIAEMRLIMEPAS